ncbi:MAG: glycosyltransferase [Candidatus Omnitrophica bacterium]|nr:glycosyltransferase [Candidatus Omnitrophota bacterium]
MVSVLMPVYNCDRFVGDAVQSILDQTYSDFEFIIIDDNSTDATWEILNRYAVKDRRIKLLRNPTNQGIVFTRNRALQTVSFGNKYIAIMDADDLAVPQRLEKQFRYLEGYPECSFLGGAMILINEEGKELGRRFYPQTHTAIQKMIGRRNPFAQPTVMARRSLFNAIGGYNPAFPVAEDYELWFRALERHAAANLPDILLYYRLSNDQTKVKQLKEILRNTILIQKTRLFQPRFFSLLNLFCFFGEIFLLLLPAAWILWLFEKKTYRKSHG